MIKKLYPFFFVTTFLFFTHFVFAQETIFSLDVSGGKGKSSRPGKSWRQPRRGYDERTGIGYNGKNAKDATQNTHGEDSGHVILNLRGSYQKRVLIGVGITGVVKDSSGHFQRSFDQKAYFRKFRTVRNPLIYLDMRGGDAGKSAPGGEGQQGAQGRPPQQATKGEQNPRSAGDGGHGGDGGLGTSGKNGGHGGNLEIKVSENESDLLVLVGSHRSGGEGSLRSPHGKGGEGGEGHVAAPGKYFLVKEWVFNEQLNIWEQADVRKFFPGGSGSRSGEEGNTPDERRADGKDGQKGNIAYHLIDESGGVTTYKSLFRLRVTDIDFTTNGDGLLSPGETTTIKTVSIKNFSQMPSPRTGFELRFLGLRDKVTGEEFRLDKPQSFRVTGAISQAQQRDINCNFTVSIPPQEGKVGEKPYRKEYEPILEIHWVRVNSIFRMSMSAYRPKKPIVAQHPFEVSPLRGPRGVKVGDEVQLTVDRYNRGTRPIGGGTSHQSRLSLELANQSTVPVEAIDFTVDGALHDLSQPYVFDSRIPPSNESSHTLGITVGSEADLFSSVVLNGTAIQDTYQSSHLMTTQAVEHRYQVAHEFNPDMAKSADVFVVTSPNAMTSPDLYRDWQKFFKLRGHELYPYNLSIHHLLYLVDEMDYDNGFKTKDPGLKSYVDLFRDKKIVILDYPYQTDIGLIYPHQVISPYEIAELNSRFGLSIQMISDQQSDLSDWSVPLYQARVSDHGDQEGLDQELGQLYAKRTTNEEQGSMDRRAYLRDHLRATYYHSSWFRPSQKELERRLYHEMKERNQEMGEWPLLSTYQNLKPESVGFGFFGWYWRLGEMTVIPVHRPREASFVWQQLPLERVVQSDNLRSQKFLVGHYHTESEAELRRVLEQTLMQVGSKDKSSFEVTMETDLKPLLVVLRQKTMVEFDRLIYDQLDLFWDHTMVREKLPSLEIVLDRINIIHLKHDLEGETEVKVIALAEYFATIETFLEVQRSTWDWWSLSTLFTKPIFQRLRRVLREIYQARKSFESKSLNLTQKRLWHKTMSETKNYLKKSLRRISVSKSLRERAFELLTEDQSRFQTSEVDVALRQSGHSVMGPREVERRERLLKSHEERRLEIQKDLERSAESMGCAKNIERYYPASD